LETGLPIRSDPGAPTSDSDIFVANVDDLMSGAVSPVNLTNSPETIDEDADWSPVAAQIAFSSHLSAADLSNTEIYVTNVNGTGLQRLTSNDYEERAPAWSPDGRRIAFMCSLGRSIHALASGFSDLSENADGTGQVQLTPTARSTPPHHGHQMDGKSCSTEIHSRSSCENRPGRSDLLGRCAALQQPGA
jgi:TolB protein